MLSSSTSDFSLPVLLNARRGRGVLFYRADNGLVTGNFSEWNAKTGVRAHLWTYVNGYLKGYKMWNKDGEVEFGGIITTILSPSPYPATMYITNDLC